MACKLFVANLHFTTSVEQLTEIFSVHGQVLEIRIAKDNDGKSKGFSFVTMNSASSASSALASLNGTFLGGRALRVELGGGGSNKSKQVNERSGGGAGGVSHDNKNIIQPHQQQQQQFASSYYSGNKLTEKDQKEKVGGVLVVSISLLLN